MITDEIVDTFVVSGTPEQIGPRLHDRYGDIVQRVSFDTPGRLGAERVARVLAGSGRLKRHFRAGSTVCPMILICGNPGPGQGDRDRRVLLCALRRRPLLRPPADPALVHVLLHPDLPGRQGARRAGEVHDVRHGVPARGAEHARRRRRSARTSAARCASPRCRCSPPATPTNAAARTAADRRGPPDRQPRTTTRPGSRNDLDALDPSHLGDYLAPLAQGLDPQGKETFIAQVARIGLADGPLTPPETQVLESLERRARHQRRAPPRHHRLHRTGPAGAVDRRRPPRRLPRRLIGRTARGRRRATTSPRSYERSRSDALTYAPTGGSLDGSTPPGLKRRHWTTDLRGADAFDRAVVALRSWAVHRGAGLALAADGPIAVGTNVAFRAPLPIGYVDGTCRIVAVVDEPDRAGFAYGTLSGASRARRGSLPRRPRRHRRRPLRRRGRLPARAPRRTPGPAPRRSPPGPRRAPLSLRDAAARPPSAIRPGSRRRSGRQLALALPHRRPLNRNLPHVVHDRHPTIMTGGVTATSGNPRARPEVLMKTVHVE